MPLSQNTAGEPLSAADGVAAAEDADERARRSGQRRRRFRTVAPKLFFESTLIVVSVALGFVVNAFREKQQDAAAAVEVVDSFRREISQNLRDVQDGYSREQYFLDHLRALSSNQTGTPAIRVITSAFPTGGLHLPTLSDAAWQTALATDKIRLVDYRTVAALSETYLIQRESVTGTAKLIQTRLFEPTTFQSANAQATIQMFSALTQQLLAQEKLLMESYQATLAKLGTKS